MTCFCETWLPHVMVNMKSGERCGNTKELKTYKWLTEQLFFKCVNETPSLASEYLYFFIKIIII
jgi:hypothetical protein